MQLYSRPLDNIIAVEYFLQNALQLPIKKDRYLKKIIPSIVDGELGVTYFNEDKQTLSRLEMRDTSYRSADDRWKLREKIIEELFTTKRLLNDDKIKLGKGGALPQTGPKPEQKAFIIIGLPASGKSSLASIIAENYRAMMIDSDYAKRKLPEYSHHLYGASIVHEESNAIIFGFEKGQKSIPALFERCLNNKYNVIIPKIGNNPKPILELAKWLKEKKNYEVHLVFAALSKRDSTIRAVYRFAKSKRYVPLGLIFDGYGNDPFVTYYYLRSKHNSLFTSFTAVSTAGKPAFLTDQSGHAPIFGYDIKNVILQL